MLKLVKNVLPPVSIYFSPSNTARNILGKNVPIDVIDILHHLFINVNVITGTFLILRTANNMYVGYLIHVSLGMVQRTSPEINIATASPYLVLMPIPRAKNSYVPRSVVLMRMYNTIFVMFMKE